MIPEAAVEAAHKAWREQAALDGSIFEYNLRAALEAAAPHMGRTITTVEELDALADGAVVRDNSGTIREMFTDSDTEDSLWCRPGSGGYLLSRQFYGALLPATVLYEPEPAK